VDQTSAASTSLDRSAVNFVPTTTTTTTYVVLAPVNQTRAGTVPPVSPPTTTALPAAASPGSPEPGVSTRSASARLQRRPFPVGLDSASTAANAE